MSACLPTRSGRAGRSYPEAASLPAIAIDQGEASFYADQFEGRQTANGERFSQDEYTAAHRTYPFGTLVRIINLRNDRIVVVRINDRGPQKLSRIIDLTRRAAEDLAMTRDGTATVRLEVVQWGTGN
jgi:rare lipoprotein A